MSGVSLVNAGVACGSGSRMVELSSWGGTVEGCYANSVLLDDECVGTKGTKVVASGVAKLNVWKGKNVCVSRVDPKKVTAKLSTAHCAAGSVECNSCACSSGTCPVTSV